MIETAALSAAAGSLVEDTALVDDIFMWMCVGYLFLYHVLFLVYSMKVRQDETMKLVMDSDAIEEEVNQNRPALQFDFTKGQRNGNNNRLLYFKAEPKKAKPKKTEEEKKQAE